MYEKKEITIRTKDLSDKRYIALKLLHRKLLNT